jgi:transposase InsO family protein
LRSNTAPTRSGPGEHAEDVLPEPRDMLAKPPAPSSRPLSIPGTEWSWDITKLLGPVKWTYYYLYVLLDIFSRYVVGWLLARQEAAALAKVLIAESCARQHIGPDQFTAPQPAHKARKDDGMMNCNAPESDHASHPAHRVRHCSRRGVHGRAAAAGPRRPCYTATGALQH